MRVVKAAQFGIQSAFIGGAFVLLGGAALADTSTQPVTYPTSPLAQSGANVKDTTGNTNTVTNSGQGTVNVSNTTNTNNQSGSNSQGGTFLSSTDQNNDSNPPTGTVSNNNNLPGSSAQNATPNNQNAQGNDPAVTNTVPKLDQNSTPAQPYMALEVPQSSFTQQPAKATPIVFFQSKPLRIQPIIVTANIADIAAALPSLPTPASAPVPPKPNSALGHLSAVLADTIVPVFFFLVSAPVRMGLSTLGLATFIVLLLGAFIFNYGLWLRRGGFATAARSDVPSSSHFFPFATPQFLGYVFAPPRYRHNPVFVVAEIKTGGYSLRGL